MKRRNIRIAVMVLGVILMFGTAKMACAEERNTKELEVIYSATTKTYMDYRKITDETSPQWKLINSNKIFVNQKGYLQTEDGFIGVALGSYFGEIGDKFIITLSSGKELKLIKVERKADIHTDQNNYAGSSNYDIIEFVIDTKTPYMKQNIMANGYIFNGNFNNNKEFEGAVVSIEKIL